MLKRIARECAKALLALVGAALVVATFLPLVPTNRWWVHVLDYPRWEGAAAMLLCAALVLLLFERARSTAHLLLAALSCGIAYDGAILWPYTPLAAREAVQIPSCERADRLRILSLNVLQKNDRADEVVRLTAEIDPDIVLLMEVNAAWLTALAPLLQAYPHHVEDASPNTYGMILLSKMPLVAPEVKRFVRVDVPAIFTGVRLPSGAELRLYAVHPRPPRVDQSAADRDAQLMATALAIHEARQPAIVVGDLNSVPWEDVVRRMDRIGGLLDPRRGRYYLPTFEADDVIPRIPLDQILFQPRVALVELRRLEDVGSDHFPLFSEVCYAPDAVEKQAPPPIRPGDLAAARRAVEEARPVPPKAAPDAPTSG